MPIIIKPKAVPVNYPSKKTSTKPTQRSYNKPNNKPYKKENKPNEDDDEDRRVYIANSTIAGINVNRLYNKSVVTTNSSESNFVININT